MSWEAGFSGAGSRRFMSASYRITRRCKQGQVDGGGAPATSALHRRWSSPRMRGYRSDCRTSPRSSEAFMIPRPLRPALSLAAAALVALLRVAPALAQHDHEHEHEHVHEATEAFGKVHFPITCKTELQPAFDRAVPLLHSFAYAEAERAFAEVGAKDPGCAMAQWGIARTNFHVIWGPPTAEESV